MFWSIIELFLNFFSISVLKIFCWAGRKVSQYSTWDARMRAHISSPDPPGRIQVWRRVVTQRCFTWVTRDHPGFTHCILQDYPILNLDIFNLLKKCIILLLAWCVCARVRVWVWAGMCEGHRITFRSRFSPSTVGCWNQSHVIRLAQQTPFPTEPVWLTILRFYYGIGGLI